MEGGLVPALIGAAQGLAQHRLLDRLIRGRTWIGLVAFALIGIVTLQLGLLKLNGGIGRALEHEALLQRENATLSIENSELAAGTRVEGQAAHLGMAFVPAGAMRFLTARPSSDATKAAHALSSANHSSVAGGGEASSVASGESQSSESHSGESQSNASTTTGASAGGESSSSSAESSAESQPSTSESEGPTSEARESSVASSESATRAEPAPTSSEPSAGSSGESASSPGNAQGGTQAGGAGE